MLWVNNVMLQVLANLFYSKNFSRTGSSINGSMLLLSLRDYISRWVHCTKMEVGQWYLTTSKVAANRQRPAIIWWTWMFSQPDCSKSGVEALGLWLIPYFLEISLHLELLPSSKSCRTFQGICLNKHRPQNDAAWYRVDQVQKYSLSRYTYWLILHVQFHGQQRIQNTSRQLSTVSYPFSIN